MDCAMGLQAPSNLIPPDTPPHHRDNMTAIALNLKGYLNKYGILTPTTISNFEIGWQGGSRNNSRVYLVRERTTQHVVVVKVLYKAQLVGIESQVVTEIEKEINLKHTNILKLLTYFFDEIRYFVVLEYADRDSIFKCLKDSQRFTETQTAIAINQVAKALDYYHSNNVIYRDIKPENLFYSSEGQIKLADFGWRMHAPFKRRKTMCGSLDYLPSEALEGKTYNEYVVRWSLGVLCYELLVGKPELQMEYTHSIDSCAQGVDLYFPSYISEGAQDFIKKLLRKNPFERMALGDVFEHPWILQHVD